MDVILDPLSFQHQVKVDIRKEVRLEGLEEFHSTSNIRIIRQRSIFHSYKGLVLDYLFPNDILKHFHKSKLAKVDKTSTFIKKEKNRTIKNLLT